MIHNTSAIGSGWGREMSALRKHSAWLVLASYLFAGTLAESFHDHRHCCGHAGVAAHEADGDHGPAAADHADHDEGTPLPVDEGCTVCQFLAQAPLAAQAVTVVRCGEISPDEVLPPVSSASSVVRDSHLARGPPAVR